jgi:hypothetical protein
MATNEFVAVTFNDGEPLDPVKLNQLSKNVTNIYQSAALANSSGGTSIQVPIVFTYRYVFQNVTANKPGQTHTFNFGGKFDPKDLSAGKVYIATSVTSAMGDADNVNISIKDAKTASPTMYCSMTGTGTRNISVDLIAICMKDII